jgi:hypothetical protein
MSKHAANWYIISIRFFRLPYRLPASTASAIGFEWIVT